MLLIINPLPNSNLSFIQPAFQIGFPSVPRPGVDVDRSFLILLSHTTFSKDSMVTAWNFFSVRSGTILLQVWRPVARNNYKLIGQTEYKANSTHGHHRVQLVPGWHIMAQIGDIIGIYSREHAIIPYDRQFDIKNKCKKANFCIKSMNPMSIGQQVECEPSPGPDCRFYSVFAECKEMGKKICK